RCRGRRLHFTAASNDDASRLWTGTGGYLRTSVQVSRGADAWFLRHSIWELSIPAEAINRDPELKAFLERRRSARDLQLRSTRGKNLVRLLSAQGCTTFDGTRSAYTLDEVRLIVESLTSQ